MYEESGNAHSKNSSGDHNDESTSLLAGASTTNVTSPQSVNNFGDPEHNKRPKNGHVHYDEEDDKGVLVVSKEPELLPVWTITCILSTAFAYGCILTTLFLITLPVECDRIEQQHPAIPKSVR
jgi:hypothetical protein